MNKIKPQDPILDFISQAPILQTFSLRSNSPSSNVRGKQNYGSYQP